jgi:hypothetical protein
MRKQSSTIESTHRATAYRRRPLDPAVLFMPGLSGLPQQRRLANESLRQFKIVMVEKHEI